MISVINLVSIVILVFGISSLLLIGILIEVFAYNNHLFEIIQNHDVINALIHKNNRLIVWIFFSITMIMEELIFRYYSISILNSYLNSQYFLIILISSITFSLYHIHIWFSFKNLKILFINLIHPFLMGLYLGFIFFSLGFISCVIAHYTIAFFMHYNLYRRYYKNQTKNKILKKKNYLFLKSFLSTFPIEVSGISFRISMNFGILYLARFS
ncbi:MAG: hypothetical protein CEE43_12620 [Promethearchaeota archaeon Loki_b32]|nr:MAG: hypothetical protein CEE43_12620 [Candidatus Lokiarchaeota archaeon Loki_b32]